MIRDMFDTVSDFVSYNLDAIGHLLCLYIIPITVAMVAYSQR